MFNKFAWKQEIYKDDLLPVIGNGLLFAVIGGILAGLLDFLCNLIGLNISFGLIIISYFVGSRVNKSYYSYHILYPTLTIIFMLIGLLFSDLSYLFCMFRSFDIFLNFIKPMFLLNILISPISNVIRSLISFNILDLFINLFNLVVYIFAFIYAYRLAKGRN
jgi:hypothetical protein